MYIYDFKIQILDYNPFLYDFRLSNYSLDDLDVRLGQLETTTDGLCAGPGSLPVLAVDLQKHCDLLQVNDDNSHKNNGDI